MSFSQFNLHPKILRALELCGYTKPTPIQTKSIPEIMKGKDLVASAQTGTGKTASFVLPALHKLINNKASSPAPRVLILTPTRELANQITGAISKYARFMHCSVVSITGGMSYKTQFNNLARPVDIIVATPGRLLDHMSNRKIDLSHVELLVLDEADRMLDMGFIDDVREIAGATPDNRQTLLFSATMDVKLTPLISKFMKHPIRIDLSEKNISPNLIKQKIYYADNSLHKSKLLTHFLKNENVYKAIIFSATKVNADELADELNTLGIKAAALHGDMRQGARNRITEQFKRGKIQFLVATDVASRGIDVKDISHVINYDLPKFSEDYVHRIGRTGRAGKEGIAISFISPFDAKHIGKIERFINQRLEVHTISGLEPQANTGATHRPGKKDKGRHRDRDKGRGSFKDREKEHNRRQFDKRKHFDDRDVRLGKVYREKKHTNTHQFDDNEIKEWQDKLDQKRKTRSEPRAERKDRSEPRSERRDRSGPRSERRDRSDFRSERRDRSGPRSERRDRSESRSERRDRSGPRSERRDRSEPRSERRDKPEARSERGGFRGRSLSGSNDKRQRSYGHSNDQRGRYRDRKEERDDHPKDMSNKKPHKHRDFSHKNRDRDNREEKSTPKQFHDNNRGFSKKFKKKRRG